MPSILSARPSRRIATQIDAAAFAFSPTHDAGDRLIQAVNRAEVDLAIGLGTQVRADERFQALARPWVAIPAGLSTTRRWASS